MDDRIHVFGIRHHGPGCARSLLAALGELEPDIVLVEGPPDAQEVVPLLTHAEMRPPVALLVYAPDEPKRAVFYPFTTFSPEWQALRFALERGIPARFIDLPLAILLAPAGGPEVEGAEPPVERMLSPREDPIGLLAEAAGYSDHELWWEHQIEQRRDAAGLFQAIMEAMTLLRAEAPKPDPDEARREAHMRQMIRAARREGFARIAVVCGAWHAPALAEPGPAKEDAALLAGLPRVKVAATWIPWTNARLSSRGGYGAGVPAPGWYAHLWEAPDRLAARWLARAAALLRAEDLPAPSSGVIEAVRLAEVLAALRDRPTPGLEELREAIQAVLCQGDPAPLALIRRRLEIGAELGAVPAETPTVPLQRDLAARRKRLRLRPSAEIRALDLDLRRPTDQARSRLLHALNLLDVPWGKLERSGGGKSTFHELWSLRWQPELEVALIEANVWGNTIESAASALIQQRADDADEVPALLALLDGAILAGLAESIAHLLTRVRSGAALAADVRQLMDAMPALARVARYGDVRATPAEEIFPMIDSFCSRIVIGLPGACASLDDAAAEEVVASIGRVQESLVTLDRAAPRAEWRLVLRRVALSDGVHGLVRGWCCRLLLEERTLDGAELQRLARLALSPVVPAATAAAWIAGVTRGSGLLLLQQDGLWTALDGWLRDLAPESFVELLPLLRRAFAGFQPPEKRAMGEKVTRLRQGGTAAPDATGGDGLVGIERERADRVLPVLARMLGVANGRAGDDGG